MNERDFFYWLQGFFELSESKTLSEKQVQIIKDHMGLVAKKVTPDRLAQVGPSPFLIDIYSNTHGPKLCSSTLGTAGKQNPPQVTQTVFSKSLELKEDEPYHPLYNVPTCLSC